MNQEKEETNSNKVKSPVKRANRSCRKNDKRRKKFMCDNLKEAKREY